MRTTIGIPESFLGVLVLLGWASSTLAQAAPETSKMRVQPQRQDNLLHVYVSPYLGGRFLSGIPREKFRVAINGQPAEIVSFSDEGFNKHRKFAAVIVLDVQRDDAFEARKQLAAGIAHMTSAKDYELVHLILATPSGMRAGGEWTNALTAAQAIRALQPEAGAESQVIEATGAALSRAYELDKFRPAVFVISGPSSRAGSILPPKTKEAVPVYLSQSGTASNALLESYARESRGGIRPAPSEGQVDSASREIVSEARKRLSDQYVFAVKAAGGIPFYYKVTVTYPTGDKSEETLSDESIPRWMVLTPAISLVALVVLGSIMFASYRRVLGKLKSGALDLSQPIPEQLHPGVTYGLSEKIQLAADRVTVRLMRMDSAPVTTSNASQDEPTKASDDEATIARAPAQSTFSVVGELAPGQPIRFEVKDSVTVGRGSCELVLPDQSVSRKHGRLYMEAGQPMVEDTGSTNGTRVNGVAVTGPTRLKKGDVVEFGDIRLTVELGGQPPAGPGDTVRR